MIGKTLGHYQIKSQLGKGGMGEVYQAKDQKLGREVAIKILPQEFSRDMERIARFQREAKVLASLNHPNIAAIHGLEESGGTSFLVLELVEGGTLADRINAGPIPVEESLEFAVQIAEALEAAHEKGVIHRDLKPSNIKVTPDGKVKVLDFGLAKAFAGEESERDLSTSPTLSDMATQKGVVLGTAPYMSPEQAKARTVDKRADIWAFGCVLYEMLAGRAAFSGPDVSEVLAAVIRAEPDWASLPENLHPRLREVLERCLTKNLKDRYRDISDVRVDIQRVLSSRDAVPAKAAVEHRAFPMMLPWLAGAVILSAAAAGIVVWNLKPSGPPQVMRFYYELPEAQQFSDTGRPIFDISPDGKQFAYSTPKGLYLRTADELEAKLIQGTEGDTQQPFFSPDGKWIGYFAGKQLRKIAVGGGTSQPLCTVENPLGASWNSDDTIVYGSAAGIQRISANGGAPELLVPPKSRLLASPQILRSGKSVLFTDSSSRKIILQSFEPREYRELFPGHSARYLPTGHIVYASGNSLMAVAFDPDRLETAGEPISAVEGVLGQFAASDSGSLIFVPSVTDAAAAERTLVWVDKNGKEEPLGAPLNRSWFPDISPNGTKLALTIEKEDRRDIYVLDLITKTLTQLTYRTSINVKPVWTPDSKRIAFLSVGLLSGLKDVGIYWKSADGSGTDEQISPLGVGLPHPSCWTPDGKTLVGEETTGQKFDIWMLTIGGDGKRKPLLNQDYSEAQPKISPDGKWIAYTSDQSGRYEIYVRPFPDVNNGIWKVSSDGGNSPLWSPVGNELFYLNGDAAMAAGVKTGRSFSIVEPPRILFHGAFLSDSLSDESPWDIDRDGKRFLMIKAPSSSAGGGQRKINVVVNWFQELKQRVPVH